jgi:RNA 3'-terminal phosphate cyclase (ATP)
MEADGEIVVHGRARCAAARAGVVNEVVLDGSEGEGGGQILRSALALSLITRRPLRVTRIRARRPRSGLLHQHLAAVRAAAAVGEAEVEGDAKGSMDLSFRPRALRGGAHRFAVGSAGSTTLVIQTILLPLLAAEEPSRVVVEGGTHNPWAPPFEFLARAFLPALVRMGARAELRLERRGFAPAGGGRITAAVEPSALAPLDATQRGVFLEGRADVLLSGLPAHVGEREAAVLAERLRPPRWTIRIDAEEAPLGPGNAVVVEARGEHATEVAVAFGAPRIPAERVARDAARRIQAWLDADVPVGEHLADQLLLPLAIAGGAFVTCAPLSSHARTNAEVIARFLPERPIRFEGDGSRVRVTCASP